MDRRQGNDRQGNHDLSGFPDACPVPNPFHVGVQASACLEMRNRFAILQCPKPIPLPFIPIPSPPIFPLSINDIPLNPGKSRVKNKCKDRGTT
jgi:hypothetical protein